MQYTAEHIALQDTVRHFIDREITPNIAAWEQADIFPAHELFAKMGKMGFLGVNKPVEYGGLGLDHSYDCLLYTSPSPRD